MFLFKADKNGDSLWMKAFPYVEGGSAVLETSNSDLIIAGNEYINSTSYPCLICTNSIGDTLWNKTYNIPPWASCTSVCKVSNGGFVIAGYLSFPNDAFLLKTDSIGNLKWLKTFSDTLGGDDEGFNVKETNDYGYILVGYTQRNYDDLLLVKTDSAGNPGGNLPVNDNFSFFYSRAVFPNPSTGIFTVSSEKDLNGEIIICDVLGNEIIQQNINAKTASLDISVEPDGIYFLKIVSGKNISIQKLLKQSR